jgi:hypothetical protein
MSAAPARRIELLASVLPQRAVAPRPLMRQPDSRVLQTSRTPAQLSLFQRPNGR